MVISFRNCKPHTHGVPSFLSAKLTDAPQEEELGHIKPLSWYDGMSLEKTSKNP
jgi:hypothetical protein